MSDGNGDGEGGETGDLEDVIFDIVWATWQALGATVVTVHLAAA